MQANANILIAATLLFLATLTPGCLTAPAGPTSTPVHNVPNSTIFLTLEPSPAANTTRPGHAQVPTTVFKEFNGNVTARHADVAGGGINDASSPANENCFTLGNLARAGFTFLHVAAYVNGSGQDSTSWRLKAHLFGPSAPPPYPSETFGKGPLVLDFNYTDYPPAADSDQPFLAVFVFPWDSPVGLADATPVHFVLDVTAMDPASIEYVGTQNHRCG